MDTVAFIIHERPFLHNVQKLPFFQVFITLRRRARARGGGCSTQILRIYLPAINLFDIPLYNCNDLNVGIFQISI